MTIPSPDKRKGFVPEYKPPWPTKEEVEAAEDDAATSPAAPAEKTDKKEKQ
jgi:hypothetical protein